MSEESMEIMEASLPPPGFEIERDETGLSCVDMIRVVTIDSNTHQAYKVACK